MVQKLLVMERDSREEMIEAIRHNVLDHDAKNGITITSLTVMKGIAGYEAWIIQEEEEFPTTEELEKMGMTE